MTCEFCTNTARHQYSAGQHPPVFRCSIHRDIKPDWWEPVQQQYEVRHAVFERIRLRRDDNDIYGRTPARTAELR